MVWFYKRLNCFKQNEKKKSNVNPQLNNKKSFENLEGEVEQKRRIEITTTKFISSYFLNFKFPLQSIL
jgi:hypothetical protein